MAMLKEDPRLEKMRFDLVPKLINEQVSSLEFKFHIQLIVRLLKFLEVHHSSSGRELGDAFLSLAFF